MSTVTSRRPSRALAVAVALVVSVSLAACTSPRNTLGTSSSLCYRAVPVATDAVHDRGKLSGVRVFGPRDLQRHQELLADLERRAGHPLHTLCVVSFHGEFRFDQVDRPVGHAPPGGSGPFAVVVVTSPQNTLLGTFVLSREPLPLRHEV